MDSAPAGPVDCVIVHYGEPGASLRLAASVSARPHTAVWLVDNAHNLNGLVGGIGEHIRPPANLGFGAAVNLGAARGSAPWLLVLNPDVTITPAVIEALRVTLSRDRSLGVVAPALVYPDGRPQLNGGRFSGWVVEVARMTGYGYLLRTLRGRLRRERTVARSRPVRRSWVSGAAILLRREAFEAVSGFDPGFFLYFEDEDLCRRLHTAGWDAAVLSSVRVEHAVGGTSRAAAPYRSARYEASRAYYHERHSGRVLRLLVQQSSRRRLADLPEP